IEFVIIGALGQWRRWRLGRAHDVWISQSELTEQFDRVVVPLIVNTDAQKFFTLWIRRRASFNAVGRRPTCLVTIIAKGHFRAVIMNKAANVVVPAAARHPRVIEPEHDLRRQRREGTESRRGLAPARKKLRQQPLPAHSGIDDMVRSESGRAE